MRAVCVGGGPAGLYFALAMKLDDPAHDITVFERNTAGSTYGWGVVLWRDLLQKLYQIDPSSARQIDQAAFRWVSQVVDVHGKQVIDTSSTGYSISRQLLLHILANRAQELGVRVEFNHEVMTREQLPDADLIVACDGVSSRIRPDGGTFGTGVSVGSNKYIWLGTDKVFKAFTFPFIDTGSGWIWAHAYGFDAGTSTFVAECSSRTWERLGFDSMSPVESLALLARIFERPLDGHQLLGQPGGGADIHWLNFRTLTNQRWRDGVVVLAGDAAHTTHFTIGSGTTLAIEDAIALARNLQQHSTTEQALASYEKERQAALIHLQSEAHLSAKWFESIARYRRLKPDQFSALFHARRFPLLPYLPPRLSYGLLKASEHTSVLRGVSNIVAAKTRMIHGRSAPAQPDDALPADSEPG